MTWRGSYSGPRHYCAPSALPSPGCSWEPPKSCCRPRLVHDLFDPPIDLLMERPEPLTGALQEYGNPVPARINSYIARYFITMKRKGRSCRFLSRVGVTRLMPCVAC